MLRIELRSSRSETSRATLSCTTDVPGPNALSADAEPQSPNELSKEEDVQVSVAPALFWRKIWLTAKKKPPMNNRSKKLGP
mmetsp:Transcript_25427/g.54208  ORF Transcript_25427/g.54208 Transcript_25427/m.54208 type:complete len:81 (-) Transcript_25427:732-974(-)